MLKITTNLKNIFYVDKEIQDIMKKYYQIKRNLISFFKKQFHLHLFELEQFKKHLIELQHLPEHLIKLEHLKKTFDRARTFTRTFDRDFVRGANNDLKFCRLLLLLWRGKNDYEFLIIQLEKMNSVRIFY